ncbi:MAG: choice-of-anchor V domain-containing protein, partial [Bacteroidota bacterium]
MKCFYSLTFLFGGLLLITLLGLGNSSGPAGNGNYYTGSPSGGGGTELTCSLCHNSGRTNYGLPQVDWTISETAGGANVTSYTPGQTYFVTVQVTAPDATVAPVGFGFQSIFLDDTATPGSPLVAGSFSGFDANTQQSTGDFSRKYIEHNKRTASGVWNFQWTAPATGFGEVRIYSVGNAVNGSGTAGDSGSESPTIITLSEAIVLPVELLDFSARAEKDRVVLDWQTVTEQDFSHFVVERSTNGEDFSPVLEQPAAGPSTYTATDINLSAGAYFYRLRQVDLDGSFSYSPVTAVRVEPTQSLTVWPNPTTGAFSFAGSTTATYRLLDGRGIVVRNGLLPGAHDLSALPQGIYFLEEQTGEQRVL